MFRKFDPYKTLTEEEIYESFAKSVRLKRLGDIMFYGVIIFSFFSDGMIRVAVIIISMIIGTFFELRFRCPVCNQLFNPKINPKKIITCYNCGTDLQ